jgi:hypothetical protein
MLASAIAVRGRRGGGIRGGGARSSRGAPDSITGRDRRTSGHSGGTRRNQPSGSGQRRCPDAGGGAGGSLLCGCSLGGRLTSGIGSGGTRPSTRRRHGSSGYRRRSPGGRRAKGRRRSPGGRRAKGRRRNPGGRRAQGRSRSRGPNSRRCSRGRPRRSRTPGGWRCRLSPELGNPSLQLLNPQRRLFGLIAQRSRLSRVGEIEQHKDRQPDDGGETGVGAH